MVNSFYPPLAVRAEALSVLRASARYWVAHPAVVASAAADYRAWAQAQRRRPREHKVPLPPARA